MAVPLMLCRYSWIVFLLSAGCRPATLPTARPESLSEAARTAPAWWAKKSSASKARSAVLASAA